MPVGGASLSYLVEMLGSKGYLLLKMSDFFAVFVHESRARQYEEHFPDLIFPVDEWACYLQTSRVYMGDHRSPVPASHIQDWLLGGEDPATLRPILYYSILYYTTLYYTILYRRLWGNITARLRGAPFTLDLVRPTRREARLRDQGQGGTASLPQCLLAPSRSRRRATATAGGRRGGLTSGGGWQREPAAQAPERVADPAPALPERDAEAADGGRGALQESARLACRPRGLRREGFVPGLWIVQMGRVASK